VSASADLVDAVVERARAGVERALMEQRPDPDMDDVLARVDEIQASGGSDPLSTMVSRTRETVDAQARGVARSEAFLQMVERARVHNPETVAAAQVAEARSLASVVDLRRRSPAANPATEPPQTAPEPVEGGRRRGKVAIYAFAAGVAAACVALTAMYGMPERLSTANDERPGQQAVRQEQSEDSSQLAEQREPLPNIPAPTVRPHATDVVRSDPPPTVDVVDAVETVEPELTPASPRRSLAALSAEAKEAWHAGDLDKAERLLRVVTARGGRSGRVQDAFADRFLIAHQRGQKKQRRQLWRSYLRRFANGRYADDARAGLCRESGADKRAACWSAYLRELPTGSYRSEAHRQLGASNR